MREFAYPIEDMTKGYYMVITIKANNDAINEFNRIVVSTQTLFAI